MESLSSFLSLKCFGPKLLFSTMGSTTSGGISHKKVAQEVSILEKLGTHKNVLHLLDWNLTQAPYLLILESVNSGTLRSFLQINKDMLSKDKDLPHLLTTAAYHISHAMRYLSSKKVVHCDLAIRNILVNGFPKDLKLTEFGLARDLTYIRIRRNGRNVNHKQVLPLRWYPPEYFRDNSYRFEGDVWAFGIVLWEMQTFGTYLPYPTLETPEELAHHICSGYRNNLPKACRPEIMQMIMDCWLDSYSQRPSFNDIVIMLEDILEDDRDYIHVETGL